MVWDETATAVKDGEVFRSLVVGGLDGADWYLEGNELMGSALIIGSP